MGNIQGEFLCGQEAVEMPSAASGGDRLCAGKAGQGSEIKSASRKSKEVSSIKYTRCCRFYAVGSIHQKDKQSVSTTESRGHILIADL